MAKRTRSRQSRSREPRNSSRKWWQSLLLLGLKCLLVVIPLVFMGSVYVDSLVREKFEGQKWAIPAKVYARPLELYPDQPFSAKGLTDALRVLGYQQAEAIAKPGQFRQADNTVEFRTRGFAFADQTEPSQSLSLAFGDKGIQRITDSNGKEKSLVRLEPLLIGSLYPGRHEDRLLIRLNEMPPVMLAGLVAVEDRYFMDHHGLSIRGILRAMWTNATAGGLVQGGSTITQQLVKNFYLSSERTLSRKVLEVWMSLLLELHYSKHDILETYLNEVYLGQEGSRAIHGFGLASQYFFRQPLSELKLHQMALLVGMVKGPSYYDPWRHEVRAIERRRVVLDVMLDQGIISRAEYDWANNQPLGVGDSSSSRPGVYPAFLDLVHRQLKSDYRDEDLLSEGLQVFTTIDPQVQWLAEHTLTEGIEKLEKSYKALTDGALQGAVVVTNPGNGEILAMVGDRNPKFPGFNRAVDAKRPVGSLLKPFVFLSAIESKNFSLASMIDDEPVKWRNANGTYWQPQNYDHKYHGKTAIYDVLANSYNQPTARVGLQVGVKHLVDVMQRGGVQTELEPLPSLLLGAIGLSPLEVASLYQTVPADGFTLPLRAIRDVYTAEGKPIKRYGLEMEQRFDAAHIQEIRYGMEAVLREGTARAAYDRFPFGMHLAGKTGTTDDMRDSWFAGFSANYNAVVWVGRDDNGKTPLTGALGALPIWTNLMLALPNQSLAPPAHSNIDWQWIDRASGNRTDEGCTGSRRLPIDRRGVQPDYVPCGGHGNSLLQQFLNN